MIRFTASRRSPRTATARGASAALLLAALASGGAPALVHDRLPGDDLGGSSTLPVTTPIGEDGDAPAHSGRPAAPDAPAGIAAAANP